MDGCAAARLGSAAARAGRAARTPRSQNAAWERNIAAVRQFHAREGHLVVPRKRVESIDGDPVGLGSFISNARRRAASRPPGRVPSWRAILPR
ncbi:helicase associated domain-containing protein [Streptomyces sp. NPDC001312]|uniref:helicase associated domain-containing protein n=1 Tax=Streptomyces sp. NPDC001312 TaxID=3364561 RepID=UPI0036C0B6E0